MKWLKVTKKQYKNIAMQIQNSLITDNISELGIGEEFRLVELCECGTCTSGNSCIRKVTNIEGLWLQGLVEKCYIVHFKDAGR